MIVDLQAAIELAKEFGGGFAAYWTHHLFHKAWHRSGHLFRRGGRRWWAKP